MPQVTQAATAGLQGWREKVGDTVAGPVAGRSPLSEEQVRAIVGAIFFVLALRYVIQAARIAIARLRQG